MGVAKGGKVLPAKGGAGAPPAEGAEATTDAGATTDAPKTDATEKKE